MEQKIGSRPVSTHACVARRMVGAFLVCGSLCQASPGRAEVYYVAPGGDDGGPGSLEAPWGTPAKAASSLFAGDTVYFRSGVYAGSIVPARSGSDGEPITYAAYEGEEVVFDGGQVVEGWVLDVGERYCATIDFTPSPLFNSSRDPAGNHGGLLLQDGAKMAYAMEASLSEVDAEGEYFMDDSGAAPHTLCVVVRDLGLGRDPNDYEMVVGRHRKGLDLDGGADFIVARGMTFRNYNDNAIHSVGSTDCVFEGLSLYSNFITGIYLTAGSDRGVIRGCSFWDNGHGGIELADSDDTLISANSFLRRDLGDGFGGNGCHIYVGPLSMLGDSTIIENNVALASGSEYGSLGFAVLNGNDCVVRNNSVTDLGLGAAGGMGGITLVQGARATVINNAVHTVYGRSCIAVFADAVADGGHRIDHNLFYKEDPTGAFNWNGWYDSLADWEAASGFSGNMYDVPGFVDAGDEDLHLTESSACVDAGSDVDAPAVDFEGVTRPQGEGYDIGAFEWVEAVEGPVIVTETLPQGFVGVAYAATIEAEGGTLPYAWSVSSGALPDGLALDPASGAISGTAEVAGSSTFTVQVTDSGSRTDARELVLTVDEPTECSDRDGDGFGDPATGCVSDRVDCDDTDPSVSPGATELCNSRDDDCDEAVDEGCPCAEGETRGCYSGPDGTEGVGECLAGVQSCESGAWGALCDGQVVPLDEECEDGLDNDCDALVDGADEDDCSDDDTGGCSCRAPGTAHPAWPGLLAVAALLGFAWGRRRGESPPSI